jgi:Lipocalin-like domain
MSTRKGLFSGLGSALVVLAALSAVGSAQGKSQEELRKPFVGTWRLVTIEGGPTSTARPTGIIMYDSHGLMNVQIMPDRPRPKWTGAPTGEQALEAIRGYTAYWGTYTIDEKAQTVTHHRQGMLDGGVVDYVRKFDLADGGNRITLTPISGGTTNPPTHLTWERVR